MFIFKKSDRYFYWISNIHNFYHYKKSKYTKSWFFFLYWSISLHRYTKCLKLYSIFNYLSSKLKKKIAFSELKLNSKKTKKLIFKYYIQSKKFMRKNKKLYKLLKKKKKLKKFYKLKKKYLKNKVLKNHSGNQFSLFKNRFIFFYINIKYLYLKQFYRYEFLFFKYWIALYFEEMALNIPTKHMSNSLTMIFRFLRKSTKSLKYLGYKKRYKLSKYFKYLKKKTKLFSFRINLNKFKSKVIKKFRNKKYYKNIGKLQKANYYRYYKLDLFFRCSYGISLKSVRLFVNQYEEVEPFLYTFKDLFLLLDRKLDYFLKNIFLFSSLEIDLLLKSNNLFINNFPVNDKNIFVSTGEFLKICNNNIQNNLLFFYNKKIKLQLFYFLDKQWFYFFFFFSKGQFNNQLSIVNYVYLNQIKNFFFYYFFIYSIETFFKTGHNNSYIKVNTMMQYKNYLELVKPLTFYCWSLKKKKNSFFYSKILKYNIYITKIISLDGDYISIKNKFNTIILLNSFSKYIILKINKLYFYFFFMLKFHIKIWFFSRHKYKIKKIISIYLKDLKQISYNMKYLLSDINKYLNDNIYKIQKIKLSNNWYESEYKCDEADIFEPKKYMFESPNDLKLYREMYGSYIIKKLNVSTNEFLNLRKIITNHLNFNKSLYLFYTNIKLIYAYSYNKLSNKNSTGKKKDIIKLLMDGSDTLKPYKDCLPQKKDSKIDEIDNILDDKFINNSENDYISDLKTLHEYFNNNIDILSCVFYSTKKFDSDKYSKLKLFINELYNISKDILTIEFQKEFNSIAVKNKDYSSSWDQYTKENNMSINKIWYIPEDRKLDLIMKYMIKQNCLRDKYLCADKYKRSLIKIENIYLTSIEKLERHKYNIFIDLGTKNEIIYKITTNYERYIKKLYECNYNIIPKKYNTFINKYFKFSTWKITDRKLKIKFCISKIIIMLKYYIKRYKVESRKYSNWLSKSIINYEKYSKYQQNAERYFYYKKELIKSTTIDSLYRLKKIDIIKKKNVSMNLVFNLKDIITEKCDSYKRFIIYNKKRSIISISKLFNSIECHSIDRLNWLLKTFCKSIKYRLLKETYNIDDYYKHIIKHRSYITDIKKTIYNYFYNKRLRFFSIQYYRHYLKLKHHVKLYKMLNKKIFNTLIYTKQFLRLYKKNYKDKILWGIAEYTDYYSNSLGRIYTEHFNKILVLDLSLDKPLINNFWRAINFNILGLTEAFYSIKSTSLIKKKEADFKYSTILKKYDPYFLDEPLLGTVNGALKSLQDLLIYKRDILYDCNEQYYIAYCKHIESIILKEIRKPNFDYKIYKKRIEKKEKTCEGDNYKIDFVYYNTINNIFGFMINIEKIKTIIRKNHYTFIFGDLIKDCSYEDFIKASNDNNNDNSFNLNIEIYKKFKLSFFTHFHITDILYTNNFNNDFFFTHVLHLYNRYYQINNLFYWSNFKYFFLESFFLIARVFSLNTNEKSYKWLFFTNQLKKRLSNFKNTYIYYIDINSKTFDIKFKIFNKIKRSDVSLFENTVFYLNVDFFSGPNAYESYAKNSVSFYNNKISLLFNQQKIILYNFLFFFKFNTKENFISYRNIIYIYKLMKKPILELVNSKWLHVIDYKELSKKLLKSYIHK